MSTVTTQRMPEAAHTDSSAVPPGYKRTKVGIIPEDWEPKRLGEIGTTYGGLTGKTKADFGNGEARYVTFLNVLENVVHDPNEFDTVRVSKGESQNPVREGDLLFNGTSETPGDLALGSVAQVAEENLFLNSFCFGYRIYEQDLHSPLFLAYYFRGSPGRQLMYALAQGATRYNMSKKQFLALRLSLPQAEEQSAIAEALSDVDGLLEALEVLIAKKRAMKQAAMQQLLTGKTRLPGFSGPWETKRLGELGSFSKGRGIKRADMADEGVPCIRYGELYTRYENYVTYPVSRISVEVAGTALPIRHGDLLFAGSGETAEEIGTCVAYLGTHEAFAGGDIVVLTPFGQDPLYLGHLMNHPSIATQKARFGQGDAVVHISTNNLAQVEVHLPPRDEQAAIATVLSDMGAEIVALERRRDKTRAIKQGMMQELLTGRVRLVEPDLVA